MTLEEILGVIAAHVGKKPPAVRLPHWLVYPIALASEGVARVTKQEPRATLDGVRMARKHMYFSSRKAEQELGYVHREPEQAIRAAVDWFKQHGYF